MPRKTPSKQGSTAKVTFELPPQVEAEDTVHLVGDFNDWSHDTTPLTRRKDGRFSTTLTLQRGQTYRYRFLIDGRHWENDWEADEYVANDFGGEDSLVHV